MGDWVLIVTVERPFEEKKSLRHYLNGFTREEAATLAVHILSRHEGYIVGVALRENQSGGD